MLFIDEMHMLVGAGAAEGAVDAANILKPSLARGELQCVGATTLDEYRKHIERDAALERRFQPVIVEEPSVEETIEILKGIKRALRRAPQADDHRRGAARPRPSWPPATSPTASCPTRPSTSSTKLRRRVRIRKLGDAALAEGSDRAASRASARRRTQAISSQQYEYAAELRDRELKLQEKHRADGAGHRSPSARRRSPIVTEEDIAEVVSMWTGIPVARIASEESQRLLQMEDALHGRVIGQDEAIIAIAKAVRRSRAGLKDPKRPIGVFMFLGPTGVGKTYLPRVLAEFMFGSEDTMIKLDMSRVHGEAQRLAAGRRASRLRRLRRRRPADRHRAAQVVLPDPARRDREGAPGRLQHAAADLR